MTPEDLRQLIEGIEQGPVTRGLEDRVLLACGWRREPDTRYWITPAKIRWRGGSIVGPSLLSNLHDAQLAVPEGLEWLVTSTGGATVSEPWPSRRMWKSSARCEPATALTLAALKARLAELEAK